MRVGEGVVQTDAPPKWRAHGEMLMGTSPRRSRNTALVAALPWILTMATRKDVGFVRGNVGASHLELATYSR